MKTLAVSIFLVAAISAGTLVPASAQQLPPFGGPLSPPFTATLSNTTPLFFGMGAEDAARALGTPLNYISGRPGDEIFMAFRNIGGSGLIHHNDRLYLQFRQGRLAGWKGDWGHNWMWH
jgi:hypothetical protein